jgi:hypothetical protein
VIVRSMDPAWVLEAPRATSRRWDSADRYDWRRSDRSRVSIAIKEFASGAEAREHVEHLPIAAPSRPLQDVGDSAFVAAVNGGSVTIHMSVGEFYVQITSPSMASTLHLAKQVAKELKR